MDSRIFVFGGEHDSRIRSDGAVFDPSDNSWTELAPLIVPRCEFGLCTFGASLYAFGGWVGDDLGGSTEKYNPEINCWELAGDMPEPKFSMGVVTHKGKLDVNYYT
jgi:actin-binding protein IPP